jgi:hypothetical protein
MRIFVNVDFSHDFTSFLEFRSVEGDKTIASAQLAQVTGMDIGRFSKSDEENPPL